MKRYVLLDRDGTLIVDRHYLGDPEGVELLPGVALGLRKLRSLGLGLIVITNQSGVGRGLFDLAAVHAVHARLRELLSAEEVTLDDIRICPHAPTEGCDCRKPRPGLVLAAASDLVFTPSDCFLIGDQNCDIELGKSLGATTVRVVSATPRSADAAVPQADYEVRDLVEAAGVIERSMKACEVPLRR